MKLNPMIVYTIYNSLIQNLYEIKVFLWEILNMHIFDILANLYVWDNKFLIPEFMGICCEFQICYKIFCVHKLTMENAFAIQRTLPSTIILSHKPIILGIHLLDIDSGVKILINWWLHWRSNCAVGHHETNYMIRLIQNFNHILSLLNLGRWATAWWWWASQLSVEVGTRYSIFGGLSASIGILDQLSAMILLVRLSCKSIVGWVGLRLMQLGVHQLQLRRWIEGARFPSRILLHYISRDVNAILGYGRLWWCVGILNIIWISY